MLYHHAFGALQPPVQRIPVASIFSLKHEVIGVGHTLWKMVDVVLQTADCRYVALPFIRIADSRIIWAREHRQLGEEVLLLVQRAIETWVQKYPGEAPGLDLFGADAELHEVIANEAPFSPVIPGMAMSVRMFDDADRYAAVAPYVREKHVIDLNARSGYGASLLTNHARSVHADTLGLHSIASCFTYMDALSPERDSYDVAIALGVDSSSVDGMVANAEHLVGEAGQIIIATPDRSALDGLETRGWIVRRVVRADGEALGEHPDWMAVRASVRSRFELPAASKAIEVTQRPLRILWALRPSAEGAFGGDVVQIRETVAALQRRGHYVTISTDRSPVPDGFDIVHLTNLTSPFETLDQAIAVERFPGPVVLMPIFIDHADEAVWGMRTVPALFASAMDEATLRDSLARLQQRVVTTGNVPPPPARAELTPNYTAAQHEIMRRVDYVIANAHSEMHRLYRYLATDVSYAVAPSCADVLTYGRHRRQQFKDRYGFDNFVLTTGRLESRKNHLLLFEAMRELGYPLLCVGKGVERAYSELLRAYRPKNTIMLPFLTEEELAAAYAAARVVAMPSWDEVVSLSSLNAAASEASLVLTRNSFEHEYFRDDASYCDPASVDSIAGAIRQAWESHDALELRRRHLRERVTREYSWDQSARLTEEAYYRVLAFNPKAKGRLQRYEVIAS